MSIINQSQADYTVTLPDMTTQTETALSNEVTILQIEELVTLELSPNVSYIEEGGTIVYTATITNTSGLTLTDTNFSILLGAGGTFVPGTVIISGSAQTTFDPVVGFSVGPIETVPITVEFQVQADEPMTVTPITNIASLEFNFIDPEAGTSTATVSSENTSVSVYSTAFTLEKSANREYAYSGAEIEYTIVITNTGTLASSEISFTDAIPAGTTFVTGSVTVDGVSQPSFDPSASFAIPDLAAGAISTVTFKVIVD